MIFVTVGTQLPFDRLIQSIDEWAEKFGECNVFAQTGAGSYKPRSIESSQFVGVEDYNRKVKESDLLIAHAGMGSIITSMEYSKPLVVMPRLAKQGEHRNDHQLATVEKFRHLRNVFAADDESQLENVIEQALNSDIAYDRGRLESRRELVSTISSFISATQTSRPSLASSISSIIQAPNNMPTKQLTDTATHGHQ